MHANFRGLVRLYLGGMGCTCTLEGAGWMYEATWVPIRREFCYRDFSFLNGRNSGVIVLYHFHLFYMPFSFVLHEELCWFLRCGYVSS
jgi:hypothetical protein